MKSSSENLILSLNRCLSVYSVPGTILGTGDIAVNKTNMGPFFTTYRLNVTQVHCLDYVLPQILGYECWTLNSEQFTGNGELIQED